MRAITIAFALSALLVVASAHADDRVHPPVPAAQDLVQQAIEQYKAGQFLESAQTLLRAYEISPAPRMLFNIARAFDHAGRLDDAARYYRMYLDSADAEPDLASSARTALDRIKTKQAADAARVSAPAAATPSPAASATPATKPAPAPTEAPPAATTGEPSYAASNVLVIGGGAIALVGLGVGLWAVDTASREKSSTDPVEKPSLRDAAHTRATIADVTTGVGVALAAAGLVLRLTARPKAPAARVGTGGAALVWAF
jgi:hypothetical protein